MRHAPLLELRNVSVLRQQTRILDDVSLKLPAGRHTVILGPNGSGKTSLLKLLVRQFYPSLIENHQGSVRIFGRDDWHIELLQQCFGVVSSELDQAFSTGRSGRMVGLEVVLSGFSGVRLQAFLPRATSAQRQQAWDSLANIGASHLAERRVATMSTGERRRVLIARALVHQPKALVLDEPTTGLDYAARHALLQQLGQLAGRGTTLMLVTHHVEEVLPEIQHVIFLKRGRVACAGEPTELLRGEALTDLFGLPIKVHHSAGHWHAVTDAKRARQQ